MKIHAAFLAATTMMAVGCDRGTTPDCSADSTCTTLGGATSGGGNNGGGTKPPDTTITTLPTSGVDWNPAYDTGAKVKTLARTAVVGVPSVIGGDSRRVVFYVEDSTLHVVASSDGQAATTFGRETVYDIRIISTDSLPISWDSRPDVGLVMKGANGRDPLSIFEPKPLHLALLQMPTIARPSSAHITSRSGATMTIWVKVRSGDPVKTPEDSLPRLDIGATRGMLYSGGSQTAISSDPFTILIP